MRVAVRSSIAAIGLVGAVVAATTLGQAAESTPEAKLIERGRYLAHDVAMCVVCHSPKDPAGNVIKGQEFRGDIMPVKSPFPRGEEWAVNAPALGPLVRGMEPAIYDLLRTGISARTGKAPRGPMPPFRLSDEDARAVIAYLKTV